MFTFVCRCQKGGTTFLRRLLALHPRLFSFDGEGRYWNWPRLSITENRVASYADKFTFDAVLLGEPPGELEAPLFFDVTPAYLISPFAPPQISFMNPHSQIIMMLREPTDRYRSNLQMELCNEPKLEGEPVLDLSHKGFHLPGRMSAFIENERASIAGSKCQDAPVNTAGLWGCWLNRASSAPLVRGLYALMIEWWFLFLPRESFLFLDSSTFFKDPSTTLAQVMSFLKLPAANYTIHSDFIASYRHPERSQNCHPSIEEMVGYYLGPEDISVIQEFYAPHVQQLRGLLNTDFAEWNPPLVHHPS